MKFGETLEKKEVVKKQKVYNTTDLDPEKDLIKDLHFNRDQLAHIFRWIHVMKKCEHGDSIVDFGCGKGHLLKVLYANGRKPGKYVGLDIRTQTIDKAKIRIKELEWASFRETDLILEDPNYFASLGADKVVSFEVIEHIGKQNADIFLRNLELCGNENATYYLSTPNFDEKVGAADNHTYDSGDGRGVDVQEFGHEELKSLLLKYFDIVEYFGTFASIRDYKPFMNEWQTKMYESLHEYYDSNLLSNLMAPMFPAQSRNTLWVLKRKSI